jgi:dihydroflavonol-4-reductase
MAGRIAFVTGSTGLLGNNLVQALLAEGWHVRALARSREKASQQLAPHDRLSIVIGDMANVAGFSQALRDVDVVFHTAAFFRDNYKGGRHWDELQRVNVDGTAALISAAYNSGVRRFVQTSSIAVLNGPPGSLIDETCERYPEDGDDYYRSKILADREVDTFLAAHEDMHAVFVLPGWMFGPGDMGPTSSGQAILDTVHGKLPGIVPGSASVVDARDVAVALIAAADRGRRGERYLAAGRHMTIGELIRVVGRAASVKVPARELPMSLLYAVAGVQELWARLSGKPVLFSLANARLIANEADRSRFNHAKSERELGLTFRPLETTVGDTIRWYRNKGWLSEPT